MSVRKNPITALVLSVIVPGLGQIFNEEKKKGLVIFASCLGLALLTYWFLGFNKFSIALALILLWSRAIADASHSISWYRSNPPSLNSHSADPHTAHA